MRLLYHHPLCPQSRHIRLLLSEKKLDYTLKQEAFWELSAEFAVLNSAMTIPVFVDESGIVLSGITPITEYLEETYPEQNYLGHFPSERAETRRIIDWFHQKCHKEATHYIIYERALRYYKHEGEPRSDIIRAAKTNLKTHLDYLAFLLQKRTWVAGDRLSSADFAAIAHLSILDYFADIAWNHHISVKEWYALLKSRPSFRPLLEDQIAGFRPCPHYTNLDF